MNPKTRFDVQRIYKSAVSVDPPAEFAQLEVSDISVVVFEELRSGSLKKTKLNAVLSKIYVNETQFYWQIDIGPRIWKAKSYRFEFRRGGELLFGVSADFRYEFFSPYDY